MSIIFWILSSILWAVSWSYRKKSIDLAKLPNWLLALMWPLIWLFVIYLFVFIFWINDNIFTDKRVIFLLFLWWVFDWFAWLMEVYVIKNTKVSKVLPYASFDKLFIILLGFLFFYWNPGYTSFKTLLISVLTVIIIMLFSIDYKNLWIEKEVKIYIFVKFLYACTTLIMWRILFEYSTLDIFAVIIFFYILFHTLNNIILKKDFSLLFKQTKQFYKYRFLSSLLWRLSFILSIMIIESSWVLIASLLSFITIVFSVFSMKLILWDSPTPKQIILSILVIFMIWIGYYFK